MRLRVAGEGPPVIKLAGLAGGVSLFREEMDDAVASGFRVAALDTTGDRWDDPARGVIGWHSLALEVAEAARRVGGRPVLWGTSFGCLVALAAAARQPERYGGLLLCVPPDPHSQPTLHGELARWALARPDPVRAARVLIAVAMFVLCGWEFAYPRALARLPRLAREARRAATPPPTYRDKLRLLVEEPPGLPPPGVPVGIVAGGWDLLTPYPGARRLAERFPGSRLRLVPAGGHCVAWSHPKRYAGTVIEELRRLTRAG